MRPDSGMLMLPGSRIAWDIHYSSGDEDVTEAVELGIYFYPKGEDPKYRQHLIRWADRPRRNRHPAQQRAADRDLLPTAQGGRIESFQPHMHLRGKAMTLEAMLPTAKAW